MAADPALLLDEGETMPPAVERCVRRLAAFNAWYQFSRNEPALSCQDAAYKRVRLGHKGIPLSDELKSFLGEYRTESGYQIFLAHARGDREIDFAKLRTLLGTSLEIRRASVEVAARLGIAYGTVNPFLMGDDVRQLFDLELRQRLGIPGTIMTNAGEHTWAVEFYPSDIVDSLPSAEWADIIEPRVEGSDRARVQAQQATPIGILTGNPCDSGVELCSSITRHLRRFMGRDSLGDVAMPKILLTSFPEIGISMEMASRERPLRLAIIAAVDELCASGAKIIAHPAHTTHYFADDIRQRAKQHGAYFVSMADATRDYVRQLAIAELAILGTQFVTDAASRWSVYNTAFEGLVVHRPSPAGWKKIHDLGYEVQQKGPTPLAFNWMRDLLRDEVPSTCNHVILLMTEFAPVARQLRNRGRHGKILIEPLDIYGEAIAQSFIDRVATAELTASAPDPIRHA